MIAMALGLSAMLAVTWWLKLGTSTCFNIFTWYLLFVYTMLNIWILVYTCYLSTHCSIWQIREWPMKPAVKRLSSYILPGPRRPHTSPRSKVATSSQQGRKLRAVVRFPVLVTWVSSVLPSNYKRLCQRVGKLPANTCKTQRFWGQRFGLRGAIERHHWPLFSCRAPWAMATQAATLGPLYHQIC